MSRSNIFEDITDELEQLSRGMENILNKVDEYKYQEIDISKISFSMFEERPVIGETVIKEIDYDSVIPKETIDLEKANINPFEKDLVEVAEPLEPTPVYKPNPAKMEELERLIDDIEHPQAAVEEPVEELIEEIPNIEENVVVEDLVDNTNMNDLLESAVVENLPEEQLTDIPNEAMLEELLSEVDMDEAEIVSAAQEEVSEAPVSNSDSMLEKDLESLLNNTDIDSWPKIDDIEIPDDIEDVVPNFEEISNEPIEENVSEHNEEIIPELNIDEVVADVASVEDVKENNENEVEDVEVIGNPSVENREYETKVKEGYYESVIQTCDATDVEKIAERIEENEYIRNQEKSVKAEEHEVENTENNTSKPNTLLNVVLIILIILLAVGMIGVLILILQATGKIPQFNELFDGKDLPAFITNILSKK